MGSDWAEWPGTPGFVPDPPEPPKSLREVVTETTAIMREMQATRWRARRQVGAILDNAIVYVIGLQVGGPDGATVSIQWGKGDGQPVEHGVPLDAIEPWSPPPPVYGANAASGQ